MMLETSAPIQAQFYVANQWQKFVVTFKVGFLYQLFCSLRKFKIKKLSMGANLRALTTEKIVNAINCEEIAS